MDWRAKNLLIIHAKSVLHSYGASTNGSKKQMNGISILV